MLAVALVVEVVPLHGGYRGVAEMSGVVHCVEPGATRSLTNRECCSLFARKSVSKQSQKEACR